MSRSPKKEAVVGAQLLLKTEFPGLVADGLWGPKTDNAYISSEPALRGRVDAYVESKGWGISDMRANGEWVARDIARGIAVSAASRHGVPASAMLYLLEREPTVRRTALGLEYRTDSRSPGGSHFGLFQMGRSAWADARELDPTIGPFEEGWRDPVTNANAAAAFMKVNMRYARYKHGYKGPFTDEILYAMHNQGHTFIPSAYSGGMGKWASVQSAAARASLAKARDQILLV